MGMMTNEQYARDLNEMIAADAGHLARFVKQGDRVLAHQMVDAIQGSKTELAKLDAMPSDADWAGVAHALVDIAIDAAREREDARAQR